MANNMKQAATIACLLVHPSAVAKPPSESKVTCSFAIEKQGKITRKTDHDVFLFF